MTIEISQESLGMNLIEQGEWLAAVHEYFPSKEMKANEGLKLFLENSKSEADVFVYVKFTKNHKIKKIYAGPRYSTELSKEIRAKIQNIISSNAEIIYRFCYFTRVPVTGAYRVLDDFQIMPPLEDWATDPFKMLQEESCPFLVELKIPFFDDNHIMQVRRQRSSRHLGHFLNLILNVPISYLNNSIKMSWANVPHSWETKYVQSGFKTNILTWKSEKLTEITCMSPISRVKNNTYFSKFSFSQNDKLEVSEAIEIYWIKYKKLKMEEKEILNRSLQWLYKSDLVSHDSKSLAFVALVFAIETLLPERQRRGACEACNTIKYDISISKMFNEFLETYAPGIENRHFKKLYEKRSLMAHSGKLLTSDTSTFDEMVLPSRLEDSNDLRLCRDLVRIALLNWINAH